MAPDELNESVSHHMCLVHVHINVASLGRRVASGDELRKCLCGEFLAAHRLAEFILPLHELAQDIHPFGWLRETLGHCCNGYAGNSGSRLQTAQVPWESSSAW